jgi:hypothetical protein
MAGKGRVSVQIDIWYKPARDFKILDVEHRIDKFDELHGLSHPLYKEGSSKNGFCLNKSTELNRPGIAGGSNS